MPGSPKKRARRAAALAELAEGYPVTEALRIPLGSANQTDAAIALAQTRAPVVHAQTTFPAMTGEQGYFYVASRIERLTELVLEEKTSLAKALSLCNIPSWQFFTVLEERPEIRAWHERIIKARAFFDVDRIPEIVKSSLDASKPSVINGVVIPGQNKDAYAIQTANKQELDMIKWQAESLLPSLYGKKSQTKNETDIRVTIRRVAKKPPVSKRESEEFED